MANNTDMVLRGIRKFGLKANHRIVSLDFVSMYTNIDRQQARDIIESKYDIIAKKTSVPKAIFMEALNFLLHRNAFFTAGSSILYQQRGLPMGGKLSKILSEIVTAHGTIAAIREASIRGFRFSFVYKYVDDFLIGMGPDDQEHGLTLAELERTFERHIPGMRVTSETETRSNYTWQLKYLKFTTIRASLTDSRVETMWSRQAYASSRVVNAYTDIAHGQKVNTITEILKKAIRYSTDCMKSIALHHAVNWVLQNGYTTSTVMAILQTIPEFDQLRNSTQDDAPRIPPSQGIVGGSANMAAPNGTAPTNANGRRH